MATHGLMTALTLYRCGTLSLRQAAAHAGQTDDAFARTLAQYGIPPHN
jgi:predicted HTH domain antitoxin